MIVLILALFLPVVSAEVMEQPVDKGFLRPATNDKLLNTGIFSKDGLYRFNFLAGPSLVAAPPNPVYIQRFPRLSDEILADYTRLHRAVKASA